APRVPRASLSSAASRRRPTNAGSCATPGECRRPVLAFPRELCFSLPMPHALRRVLTIVALLVTVPSARAALTTQNIVSGLTPADLANAILGSGVSISNVSLRGCETGLGTFAGGTGIIGLEA